MNKKRSFFERLAGNLRFDDDEEDDELETPPQRQEIRRSFSPAAAVPEEKRELRVNAPSVKTEEQTPEPHEEEIGELPVDVYETQGEIIIQTLIAGVLPEHLSINITRDTVIISGRREENRSIPEENYHIRELYWGSFGRTVHLPAEIEIDTAEAIERHGMLMIKLPKIDKQRKTALKIKSI